MDPPPPAAKPAQLRADAPAQVDEPERIGRFRVLSHLGRGGMGEVLAAVDPALDRRVAIKLVDDARIRRDHHAQTRLLREARAMAQLHHPNVAEVYEVGFDEGRPFIAMEEFDGGTLRQHLRARANASWRDIVEAFTAAGRGLSAAHLAGMVHCDFKPDNVLVGLDGRICVSDFGLAAASLDSRAPISSNSQIARNGGVGTPAYMAPEQHYGERVDARADQFAFCVALWEALFGDLPFVGHDVQTYVASIESRRLTTKRASRAVPKWIAHVLLRGMSARPDDRYPSMAALLDEFDDDDAQPPHRMRPMVKLAAIMAPLPLLGLLMEPSLAVIAALELGALALAATIAWRRREWLLRNRFNARFIGAMLFFLAALPIATAGVWLGGLDPALARVLMPLLVGLSGSVFAASVDARGIACVVVFGTAFIISAVWPHTAPLSMTISSCTGLLILRWIWGPDPARRRAERIARATPRANYDEPTVPLESIGRFRVERVRRRGRHGALVDAFDPALDRPVTIWVGHSVTLEARALAKLRHPNLVRVFEIGHHGELVYQAMEAVAGRTLSDMLAADPRLGWQAILPVYLEAAEGLVAANRAGVAHAAFSADHIYIGASDQVRIGGFRMLAPEWGTSASSPAPEIVRGSLPDERSDQFSFCASLWESLYGAAPFPTQHRAHYLRAIARGAPPRPSLDGAPGWLHCILSRGLSADPANRFESFEQLIDALSRPPQPYAEARRVWLPVMGLALPALAAVPLLLSWFTGETDNVLSYPAVLALDALALAVALLGQALSAQRGVTVQARVLMRLLVATMAWSMIVTATCWLTDFPQQHAEAVHFLVWFMVTGTAAALVEPRILPTALAFGAAFLLALGAPETAHASLAGSVIVFSINIFVLTRHAGERDMARLAEARRTRVPAEAIAVVPAADEPATVRRISHEPTRERLAPATV